ncbi:MAG: sensor histidine kinase [Hyphomicrobium sp.]
MSQELSSTPLTSSPAAASNPAAHDVELIGTVGVYLAGFGIFGVIWLDCELVVTRTSGGLVKFVTTGLPLTTSLLATIGLEREILSLRDTPNRLLELPAVAVATATGVTSRLNFSFFWDSARDMPMALAYKTSAQTDLELELSRQIRARLMAEAEVTAKSKELARINADLESFTAIVSHDLKAPLRHMRTLSAALTTDLLQRAATREIAQLADIEHQAQRMSNMLTALLDYASLGRKYEAIESCDTATLMRRIVSSMPRGAHAIDIAGQWPTIQTLCAPLDLVMRNLIDNALKHHDRAKGTIVVTGDDQPNALVMTFADDGPGIDPHHHESIFLPFRTLDVDHRAESTGLGLAMVRRMVDAVGGTITIQSDPARCRGTAFKVVWPKRIET